MAKNLKKGMEVASRSRVGIYVCIGLPFLILAATLGVWIFDVVLPGSRLQAELESARQSKIALTPEEFLHKSAGDGIARKPDQLKPLADVWRKLDELSRMQLQETIYEFSTPEGSDKVIRAEDLNLAKKIVSTWVALASVSDFGLKRDWAARESVLEPHYHVVTASARLSCHYAIAQARKGEIRQAFGVLSATRKIGSTYAKNGGLDALSVQISIETQALEAAERIMIRHHERASVRELFENWIEQRGEQPQYLAAVEAEAMRTIYILSNANNYNSQNLYGSKSFLRGNTLRNAAAVRMSEFWRGFIPETRKTSKDVYQFRDQFSHKLGEFEKQNSPSKMLPVTLLVWCQGKLDAAAALQVRYQLAKGFSIVQQYRRDHGKFPMQEADMPKLPSDPYGNSQIQYVRQDGGFILYSIGSDRVDNRGKSNSESSIGSDIVLRHVGSSLENTGY